MAYTPLMPRVYLVLWNDATGASEQMVFAVKDPESGARLARIKLREMADPDLRITVHVEGTGIVSEHKLNNEADGN